MLQDCEARAWMADVVKTPFEKQLGSEYFQELRSWIEKSLKLREISSGCVAQQLNQRNIIVFQLFSAVHLQLRLSLSDLVAQSAE